MRTIHRKLSESRIKPGELIAWAQDNLVIDMSTPSFDLGPYPGGENFLQFYDASYKAIDPDTGDFSKAKGFRIFTDDDCVRLSFDFNDIVSVEPDEDTIVINSRQGYTLRFEM